MENTVEEKGLEVFGTKEVSVKEFMGGTDKSLMLLENPELAKENLIALRQKHEARVEELILVEILSPAKLKELNSIRGELREPRYLVQKIEKNNISVFEAYKKTDKANLKDLIEINKSLEDKAQKKIKIEDERKENEKLEKQRIENERIEAIKAKIDSIETESFAIIQKMTFQNVIPDGAAIGLICKQEFDFEEYDILFEQTLARIENAIKDKIDDLNERENQRIAREEAEEENRKLKAKQDLQAKRLNEIMPYVVFGESVDLTNISDIEESAYSEILSSKKALFEADVKQKKEAQEELEAKAEEEKEAIYEIRKKRLEDAGMLYSDEYDTLWLKEEPEYILLKEDVADYSALEFEETFSEVQKIIHDAKDKIEKEKVFEIRKSRLAEIGIVEKENGWFSDTNNDSTMNYNLVYESDAEKFEQTILESKEALKIGNDLREKAEAQKALDEQKSKEDAERLKKENKARVKRLAKEKNDVAKIIEQRFILFRFDLDIDNIEISSFIQDATDKMASLKLELLTELEKL